jgi:hypothetical protein
LLPRRSKYGEIERGRQKTPTAGSPGFSGRSGWESR